MTTRFTVLILALLFASELFASEVIGSVHVTDWEDGSTRFFYFSEGRLLRLTYKYDPAEEAFWSVSPKWHEQSLSKKDMTKLAAKFAAFGLSSWEDRYENVPEGEKICRGLSWNVDIRTSADKYVSSGLCDAPTEFSDFRDYLVGFKSGRDGT